MTTDVREAPFDVASAVALAQEAMAVMHRCAVLLNAVADQATAQAALAPAEALLEEINELYLQRCGMAEPAPEQAEAVCRIEEDDYTRCYQEWLSLANTLARVDYYGVSDLADILEDFDGFALLNSPRELKSAPAETELTEQAFSQAKPYIDRLIAHLERLQQFERSLAAEPDKATLAELAALLAEKPEPPSSDLQNLLATYPSLAQAVDIWQQAIAETEKRMAR